ncbi:MAG: hypothetical protein ABIX28_15615, partial [Vicinamibacterales bacterium]
MNIGVHSASAAPAGAGVAPSGHDGAAPAASSREAAHFQSLVDGRTRPERPATAGEPVSRDTGRPKSPVRGGAAPAAKAGPAAKAPEGTCPSRTDRAPEVVGTQPVVRRPDHTREERLPETPAAGESASDSALLAALAAMFGTPPLVVAPTQPTAEEPGLTAIATGGNTELGGAVAAAPAALPDVEPQPAGTVTAEVVKAIGLELASHADPPRPGAAQPATQTPAQEITPATVAPAPSAAARALARALGAMTSESPIASAPPAAAAPAGSAVEPQPAAVVPEPGTETVATAATGRRPLAARGIVTPTTAATFAPAVSPQPADITVEGVLRKAS